MRNDDFKEFNYYPDRNEFEYWIASVWELAENTEYTAEMSTHPELVDQGYSVLHVSPLGYATPDGPDEGKKLNASWPVLPDTVLSGARRGYRIWLANCLSAVTWAMMQPEVIGNRVSFFGTSQGGGAALLLGSLFKDKGVRCVAADVPFLTHYPLATAWFRIYA